MGPATDPGSPARPGARRGRGALVRIVTYGTVAGLLLVAHLEVEHWPATSYRLFSQVRTDRSVGLELVAVHEDGTRERVSLVGAGEVLTTTSHQFPRLSAEPPEVRRRKVLAWLAIAEVDPSTVVAVQLERVERRFDPDSGPSTELRRTVVDEVVL